MDKYNITTDNINNSIKNFLDDIYKVIGSSKNPGIYFVVAGPGAGKSGLENFIKNKLREEGEENASVNADKIAEYHPFYQDAIRELPEDCYKITRQLVKPASPIIYDSLRQNKINIVCERVFNKGQRDIDFVYDFKNSGYKVSVNIMATDIFISRLSCYEREAKMLADGESPRGISKETQEKMYNSFIKEIQQLQNSGLCDEINVYIRGEKINEPKLVYSLGDNKYRDFVDALYSERLKQRKQILANPKDYLSRLEEAKCAIETTGIDSSLVEHSLNGIEELKKDFLNELENQKIKE